MKVLNAFFLTIAIIISFSCTRTLECIDSNITLSFKGFLKAEIDTLIIRKFKANDNYQTLIQTFVADTLQMGYISHADTIDIQLYAPGTEIKTGYDWEVFVPARNKTVRLSAIESEKRSVECSGLSYKCMCFNEIRSYKFDNQLITTATGNSKGNYFVYIQ